MQPSSTVEIVVKTFICPLTGEVSTVDSGCKRTSRVRAEHYVKIKSAKWDDPDKTGAQDAIYFVDPAHLMKLMEERHDGTHGWHVGESGGSRMVRAYTGQSSGTRLQQTNGGEFPFMDAP